MFSTLIAAGIGFLIRYIVPGRHEYGSLLVPAAAAATTSALWAILVWFGWTFDGGWIWFVSLTVGGLVALALSIILPRTRRASDHELLQRLSRA